MQAQQIPCVRMQQVQQKGRRWPANDALGLAGVGQGQLAVGAIYRDLLRFFMVAPPGGAGCLEKLQLHGNELRELPQSISGLTSLKSLSLQGNALQHLPDGITRLQVGMLPSNVGARKFCNTCLRLAVLVCSC